MYTIEDAGLLKFDFLGIRNLTILGDAIRIAKEQYGTEIDIDSSSKRSAGKIVATIASEARSL